MFLNDRGTRRQQQSQHELCDVQQKHLVSQLNSKVHPPPLAPSHSLHVLVSLFPLPVLFRSLLFSATSCISLFCLMLKDVLFPKMNEEEQHPRIHRSILSEIKEA